MEIQILRVFYNNQKKDGTMYKNKDGSQATLVNMQVDLKTVDDPDFKGYISYWDSTNQIAWKAGDVISGNVVKNGDFFNFKIPSKLEVRMDNLEDRIEVLENKTGVKVQKVEEIKDEGLPF